MLALLKRFQNSVKHWGLYNTIFLVIPEYILNRILIQLKQKEIQKAIKDAGTNVILKEIHGSKMYLDLTDAGLPRDLLVDETREHYATQQVISFLKPGDTVVDIGANIGYYTLLEAKIVGDTGFVYAIEPVPDTFNMLMKNIEVNKYTNIQALNLAVGDKKAKVEMYMCHNHCNLSSMKPLPNMSTTKIEVPQITIDDFLSDKPLPRLIRMDVEGYEYQIVHGMQNTLSKPGALCVFIELHFHLLKREESLEILRTFKNHGFHLLAATIEKQGQMKHTKLLTASSFFHKQLQNMPINHGVLNWSLDDIINNENVLSGKWCALEMFFYRE